MRSSYFIIVIVLSWFLAGLGLATAAGVSPPAESSFKYDPMQSRQLMDELYQSKGETRRQIASRVSDIEAINQPGLSESLRNLSRFSYIPGVHTDSTVLDELFNLEYFLKKKLSGRLIDWHAFRDLSPEIPRMELAVQRQDWRRYIAMFEKIFRNRRRDQIPEYFRMNLALAFESLGQHDKATETLEGLAIWFPVSTESIWAFRRLHSYRERTSFPYLPSTRFLLSFSRNDMQGTGAIEFVKTALDGQVNRAGVVTTLQGVERFKFLVDLRFYGEAEEMIPSIDRQIAKTHRDFFQLELLKARVFEERAQAQEAVRRLQKLQAHARNSQELFDGKYLLAHILLRSRRYQEAETVFRQIPRYPRSKVAPMWYAFLSAYRDGNYQNALQILQSSQLALPHGEYAGAKEYWQAKVHEKLGKSDAAQMAYQGLMRAFPDSFYAMLAVNQSPEIVQHPLAKNRIKELRIGGRNLLQAAVADKQKMLHPSQKLQLLASTSNVALMNASHDIFEPRQNALRNKNLSKDFPLLSQDIMAYVDQKNASELFLLLSIIKAESCFQAQDVSHAGARGLMQIMPYTARKIANRLGDKQFDLNLLMLPQLNVMYGSFYIGFLRERLKSDPIIAAAYNAGPKALRRWLERCADCDLDEFVELIPYTETRRYVKQVLVNTGYYSRIYLGHYPSVSLHFLPSPLSIDDQVF
jgi:soluble lytic murein transglycosylase-like protein